MHELLRVVLNRRTLLLFFLALFLNITFCIYQCNDSKDITLMGGDLRQYIDSYPGYLEQTQQNVTLLQGLSLYGKVDSFALRNIQKTSKDYGKLTDIQIAEGENRGITIYSRFKLTHFLMLGFAIYLVIQFTHEQKKGLDLLVRTTAYGRNVLLLNRIAILCICMLAEAFVLYGSNMAVVSVIYPGAELNRSIQSVPDFMKCMYEINIGQFLVGDILFKALAAALAGMLFLALSVLLPLTAAMALFIVIMASEYILYLTIIPTSAFSWLKYLNICAVLFGREGFINYLNLNFFGYPVELNLMQLGMCMVFMIFLATGSLFVCRRTRKSTKGRLLMWIDRLFAWSSRHRICPPGVVWELRKILFYQKGLIILVLAGYLAYSSAMEYRYADLRNPYEMMWYEQFSGPLDDEKMQDMYKEQSKLERRMAWLTKECDRLSDSIVQYFDDPHQMQIISVYLSNYKSEIDELEKKLAGISKVISQAESEMEYMKRTGKQLWLLEPYTYYLLLKNDYRTYQRNRMYILIAVITAFSGCMAYENKSHMEQTLHTLYKGRNTVVNKLIIVALFSALTALGIHMIQFIQIGRAFHYHAMNYPVQSIEFLREFSLDISIRGYLCLLYGWRCLYAAVVGILVAGISYLTKDRVTSLAVGAAGLIMPVFIVSLL